MICIKFYNNTTLFKDVAHICGITIKKGRRQENDSNKRMITFPPGERIGVKIRN